MTPLAFLIVATAINLVVIWFTYPKGKNNEHR